MTEHQLHELIIAMQPSLLDWLSGLVVPILSVLVTAVIAWRSISEHRRLRMKEDSRERYRERFVFGRRVERWLMKAVIRQREGHEVADFVVPEDFGDMSQVAREMRDAKEAEELCALIAAMYLYVANVPSEQGPNDEFAEAVKVCKDFINRWIEDPHTSVPSQLKQYH